MPRLQSRFLVNMPRSLPFLGLAVLVAGGLWAQPADAPLTVTGTLIDERGAPAAGVEVVLRPYPSDYELDLHLLGEPDALPEAVDRTVSGPDGTFSLAAPAPGPYRLEIRPAAPADESAAVLPPVYGNLAPLSAPRVLEPNELPDRHRVAVRVLDGGGQPVKGALVIAIPTSARSERHTRVASHEQPERLYPRFHRAVASADTEGLARFLMPTPEVNVVVSAPGFAMAKAKTRSGRAAFRLDRASGIRFRVRGPKGEPAPGVLIRTRSDSRVPLAVTDDHGEALISSIADSTVTFELERADHAFTEMSPREPSPAGASTGERIVDVRLEAPIRVSGRAVDAASGLPIAGAVVWVAALPGHAAYSDQTGVFDLNTCPVKGEVGLRVNARGYISASIRRPAAESAAAEVSIALKPSAPVSGLVTDTADRPVAGANVRVEWRGTQSLASFMTHRPQRTTSAPDGSFRLADLGYGSPYRFTVYAEGFASTVLDVPPFERGVTANPVRIVLTKGRRARGTVVDTEGSPVAGAEVTLRWPKENESAFSFNRLDAAEPTATDERGEFSFPAVTAGEYDVRVTHSEYVNTGSATTDVPQGEGDIDLGAFTLVPGAEIDGIVNDPDGQPVSGATVQVMRFGPDRDQERTTTTDGDGRFRITGLPHELVDVTVQADGYPTFVLPGARPATGELIVIELAAGASLAGRVVGASGNGVAGASVRLKPDITTRLRSHISSRDTFKRTDADGRFRFDHVIAGTWSLEASAGATAAKIEAIELPPGTTQEFELQLRAQDQLTVIVSTHRGQPVADASIQVAAKGATTQNSYGRTDSSGRAQIEIAPGPALVTVEHPEQPDESRQVIFDPGNNELAIQLQAGGEISGTVRSAAGAPLAQATVEAHSEDVLDIEVTLREYLSQPARTVSDRNGQFRLTGLEQGRYLLAASAPGYAESGPAQPIEIDGQSVSGVDIVLEPGASLTGAVTGLEPGDLAQVAITASRDALWQGTTPDAEGNFALQDLAPGAWAIVARLGDFATRTVERSITIEPGVAEAFVELPFERGLRLSGQVLAAGEPLSRGFLSADRQGGGDGARAPTDHRGHFEMEGLEPGSYRLSISRFAGSTEYRSIDLQTDHEGLLIDLQPEAIIAGVVLDATTGQPLEGVWLTAGDAAAVAALARGEESQTVHRTMTIAGSAYSMVGGRFEVRLGPSAEQLWVNHDGYQSARLSLAIAPGQHQSGIVIELQPAASEPPNP